MGLLYYYCPLLKVKTNLVYNKCLPNEVRIRKTINTFYPKTMNCLLAICWISTSKIKEQYYFINLKKNYGWCK